MSLNRIQSYSSVLESAVRQAREHSRTSLTEPQGKSILKACGLTVPSSHVVSGTDPLDGIFAQLNVPLALKIISEKIIHKSDVGGVALHIDSVQSLLHARQTMAARLKAKGYASENFLIEEMAPQGIEMVVGGFVDDDFGPMVMVGFGGIFIEVNKDVTFGICPIQRSDALEMIEALRGAPLLKGVRGQKPVDLEPIVQALLAIGAGDGVLMQYSHEITEIDINPLIVTTTSAYAVDARFILTESA